MTCVFCQIVAGELSSVACYEDQHTVAIMDLRQPDWPNAAHVLVLPRRHVEVIDHLSERDAATLMASVIKVSQALRTVCNPSGISMWQSNGESAGQEVPHVHVHLLTRTAGDGLLRIYPEPPETPDQAELKPLAHKLRTSLKHS